MTRTASNCDLENRSSQVCEAICEYSTQGLPLRVPSVRKRSDVGEIPTEWEVKSIGQLGKITTGPFGTLLKASEYSASDGVPLISVGEVGAGCFSVSEKTPRVPPEVVRRLPQYVLRKGDIVFGRKGAVDRSARVTDAEDGWFLGSDGISIRPAKSCFAPYLAWQLQRSEVQAWLLQNAVGTTMASLNQGVLSRVRVPIAPDSEQRAIAEALSDVDGLLGALDALIAKKRAMKQAAMQQLLTGKTRLPGFSGEWETKRLGEFGQFLKGSGVARADAQSGSLPCVRYGEIYTVHSDYIRDFHSWISSAVASSATQLQQGDLLFAGSGETKAEIGKCVAFVQEGEAYAGGDIVILRPGGVDSTYLGFVLNTEAVNRQKASLGQGDAVVHISAKALAQVSVRIPPVDEQAAIAQLLIDMDDEIAALEHRLEKTYAIKQGMMQQLLTGRIRLVQPVKAATETAMP